MECYLISVGVYHGICNLISIGVYHGMLTDIFRCISWNVT